VFEKMADLVTLESNFIKTLKWKYIFDGPLNITNHYDELLRLIDMLAGKIFTIKGLEKGLEAFAYLHNLCDPVSEKRTITTLLFSDWFIKELPPYLGKLQLFMNKFDFIINLVRPYLKYAVYNDISTDMDNRGHQHQDFLHKEMYRHQKLRLSEQRQLRQLQHQQQLQRQQQLRQQQLQHQHRLQFQLLYQQRQQQQQNDNTIERFNVETNEKEIIIKPKEDIIEEQNATIKREKRKRKRTEIKLEESERDFKTVKEALDKSKEELEDSQEQCQDMINFDSVQKDYIAKLKEQIKTLGETPATN